VCVLPLGLASAFLEWAIPGMAEATWWIAGAAMSCADVMVEWLVGVTGVLAPRWPGALAACGASWGLMGLMCTRGRFLRLASAAILTLGVAGCAIPSAIDGFRVHVFHVGDGDATLIQDTGGRTVMIDGGRTGTGRRVLLPWFRREGVDRIDWLVLSHGHDDHWGGIAEISDRLEICAIAVNGSPASQRAAVSIARRSPGCDGVPTLVRRVRNGHKLKLGDLRLDVLGPIDLGQRASENDRSLLVRLSRGDVEWWFPGDLESKETLGNLKRSTRLTVLKAPHHGRASETFFELTRKLRPDLIVVTADELHRGLAEDLRRASSRAKVWATGHSGSLDFFPRAGRHFFRGPASGYP